MMRRAGTTLFLLATLGLVAGCGDGAARAVDEPAFASCVEADGISTTGADDWDEAEWRKLLSQPAALQCAADELDDHARETVLREAFPPYWDGGDETRERLLARSVALVRYAETETSRDPGASTDRGLATSAAVITDLEWLETADADGRAQEVTVAVLAARGELPGFERYQKEAYPSDEEDAEALSYYDYGTELMRSSTTIADSYRDLYDELRSRLGPLTTEE